MACERYVGSLAGVAAGEPAGLEIEEHLARCEACRTELRALTGALALVDAELRQRLAPEPSPTLRARIRQAVAEEGASAIKYHRFVWPLAAAAAVALFALAVAVTRREGRPAESTRAGLDRQTTVAESSPSASPWAPASNAPNDAVHSSSAAAARETTRSPDIWTPRARAGVTSVAPPPHPEEPEVLVPPGEAEALFRFALGLRRRQVQPGSLLATAEVSAPLPEIEPIDVAPLDIAPLDSTSSGT